MANANSPQLAPDRLISMLVKQPAPFLSKDQENSAYVSWSPSGDSFIVAKPDAFARELLPTVFKHNNYTSFVRQLNIYGFRKLPAQHQEFCHPSFKRGQPQLLADIHRGGINNPVSQADGPAAEIAGLKSQVDKLSKALSYALAELHRRGYDTLRFDWKELVFVDPNAAIGPSSVLKGEPTAQGGVQHAKRPAASGSMLHLQNTVDEVRAVKSDNGELPPAKMQRTDGVGEAPAVPMPHMQQPDMGAHSQGYQQQPQMMQMHQYPPAPLEHEIPAPSSAPNAVPQMHSTGIPQPVPGPFLPMHPHPHEVSTAPDGAMHVVPQAVVPIQGMPQHTAVPTAMPDTSSSGGGGVPAPPNEGTAMFDVPPPHVVHNPNPASVGHPSVQTSVMPPGAYQQPVDVSGQVAPVHRSMHAVHDVPSQQHVGQEMMAQQAIVPADGSGHSVAREDNLFSGSVDLNNPVQKPVGPEAIIPSTALEMQPAVTAGEYQVP